MLQHATAPFSASGFPMPVHMMGLERLAQSLQREGRATEALLLFEHLAVIRPRDEEILLPLVKLPLTLVSLVFKAIYAMGPIGIILCILVFIALFARNLMGPTKA